MSTFIPTYSDPSDALITAICDLLRDGPGGDIASPTWADPDKNPAPTDHWLFPPGTRLYRYDEPDTLTPPAVLVAQPEPSTRRVEHDARFWIVPIYLGIIWTRPMPRSEAESIRRRLERLFGIGVQDGATARPITELLTTDDVQCHFCRNVSADFLKLEDNRPKFEVNITYFASGKYTAP
jgi:hypothetical protein